MINFEYTSNIKNDIVINQISVVFTILNVTIVSVFTSVKLVTVSKLGLKNIFIPGDCKKQIQPWIITY